MSDWQTTNSAYGSFYDPDTKLQIYANHHSKLVESNIDSSNHFCNKPKMILWKACRAYNDTIVNVYVQLVIPSDAQIINVSGGDKYRVSKAFVNKIVDKNQNEYQECRSFLYGPSIVYRTGTTVYPDLFDSDPLIECSHGIHGHKSIDECDWGSTPPP